jgi:hypothetical protein
VDVRSINRKKVRHNIPNICIFLWRLGSYPINRCMARKVSEGCYTFHPLGIDIPLYSPEDDRSRTGSGPYGIPEPLRRRPLYYELESYRLALAAGAEEDDIKKCGLYFGEKPAFKVFMNGQPISSSDMRICDLGDWTRPPENCGFQIAVDPVLGRLAFPADINHGAEPAVEVSYSYGFSSKLGGGGYPRQDLALATEEAPSSQVRQADLGPSSPSDRVLEIIDSGTVQGDLIITLHPGQKLTVQGSSGHFPAIDGKIIITSAGNEIVTNALVILDGLLIGESIQVEGIEELSLKIQDCTIRPWIERAADGSPLLPKNPSISWTTKGSRGSILLNRSISGRLEAPEDVQIEILDSIVDSLEDTNLALSGSNHGDAGKASIMRSTLIGSIQVKEIGLAENSIFTGSVICSLIQRGCVRFCYLPQTSRVPRRFQCLSEADNAGLPESPGIKPLFTDTFYGRPGYMQLSDICSQAIRQGAENGSEMGAFHNLCCPCREADLRERLLEYLRFGLDAGIIYVT